MSAARPASDDRSLDGIRITDEAVVNVAGKPAAAVGEEADGGELGAVETGRVGNETCTLGTVTDMLGTETCTLGTETGMLDTETCTSGTVLDAETGTAGVETWVAGPLLWPWRAAGAAADGDDDAAELGAAAGVPGEPAWPDETAAAPLPECPVAAAAAGVAEDVAGAIAAAPDALGAGPVTDGAGTAGSATPPALAAVSTAR